MSTPVLVQGVSGQQTSTVDVTGGLSYDIRFLAGTQSGNCIIVCGTCQSSAGTITVSDDKSNSYGSVIVEDTDSGHSQKTFIFAAFNVASDTRVISISPASTDHFFLGSIYELTNITSVDVSTGNHSRSATLTAGSFSPTVDNDFLFMYGFCDGVLGSDANPTTFTVGSTQNNTTWSLITTDLSGAMFAQVGNQTTHTAINPTMTQNAVTDFSCVCVAFKTGSSGSVPIGMRVRFMQHTDTSWVGANPGNFTIQFPCAGNLLVMQFEGTSSMTLSVVSDTPGNTWNQRQLQQGNGHTVQNFSADNATTANDYKITVNEATGNGQETVQLYDVVGALTPTSYDTAVGQNGNQTVAGTLATTGITPSGASGLVFFMLGVAGDTVGSVTGGPLFISIIFGGESGNDVQTDRNNGYAVQRPPNTSQINPVWNNLFGSAFGGWAYNAVSYLPALTSNEQKGYQITVNDNL